MLYEKCPELREWWFKVNLYGTGHGRPSHLFVKFPRSSFINVSLVTRRDRPEIKRAEGPSGTSFNISIGAGFSCPEFRLDRRTI